jgi:glycine betaine/choline ABC-type transport system substrate-binding protein
LNFVPSLSRSRLGGLCIALIIALLLSSCARSAPIRIGAKPFSEQRILAQAIRVLLESEGYTVRPIVECKDTYDCERSLQSGRIDMMVEYSGTAAQLIGMPPADGADLFAHVRSTYEPLGLTWLGKLGFDNGYLWLMPENRARSLGVGSLSDLAKQGRIRVACPPEYARRPRDGLVATTQRYGIELAGDPVIIADPIARYEAALAGKVDVVVGYATDGALRDWGVMRLADDAGFFPEYEAAIVARSERLEREPRLGEVLARLEGELPNDAMQDLNYAVEIEGRSPRMVAKQFLYDAGIFESDKKPVTTRSVMTIAMANEKGMDQYGPGTLRAVRAVFPDRVVELETFDEPVSAVRRSKARLAVVGAERFFEQGRRGDVRRNQDLEAIAVLGNRLVHVVVPEDSDNRPLTGTVGVLRHDEGLNVGSVLVELAGAQERSSDTVEALLEGVRSGELSSAVFLAEPGREDVKAALESDGLRLVSARRWWKPDYRFELPFLRRARVEESQVAVDTLSAQVVLAGPSRDSAPVKNADGPVAALSSSSQPVTLDAVRAISEELGGTEAPDPALPSIWTVGEVDRAEDDEVSMPAVIRSLLNIGVVLFLVWLAFVTVRREKPPRPAE